MCSIFGRVFQFCRTDSMLWFPALLFGTGSIEARKNMGVMTPCFVARRYIPLRVVSTMIATMLVGSPRARSTSGAAMRTTVPTGIMSCVDCLEARCCIFLACFTRFFKASFLNSERRGLTKGDLLLLEFCCASGETGLLIISPPIPTVKCPVCTCG